MRPARPDLLPVDDPVAAAIVGARRLGAQSRKVRAGGRFGEELAPGDVALKRRLDEARLLLGSAMFRDHGQRHAGADRGERSEERSVGKEGVSKWRLRWLPDPEKKKATCRLG